MVVMRNSTPASLDALVAVMYDPKFRSELSSEQGKMLTDLCQMLNGLRNTYVPWGMPEQAKLEAETDLVKRLDGYYKGTARERETLDLSLMAQGNHTPWDVAKKAQPDLDAAGITRRKMLASGAKGTLGVLGGLSLLGGTFTKALHVTKEILDPPAYNGFAIPGVLQDALANEQHERELYCQTVLNNLKHVSVISPAEQGAFRKKMGAPPYVDPLQKETLTRRIRFANDMLGRVDVMGQRLARLPADTHLERATVALGEIRGSFLAEKEIIDQYGTNMPGSPQQREDRKFANDAAVVGILGGVLATLVHYNMLVPVEENIAKDRNDILAAKLKEELDKFAPIYPQCRSRVSRSSQGAEK